MRREPQSLWCACRPGDEELLVAELGRALPASTHRAAAPGWTASELAPPERAASPSLALAAQCLLDAVVVQDASISALARSASAQVCEALADHAGPWRLHAFCVELPGSPVRASRVARVAEQLRELLHRRQRRLLRTLGADCAAPWVPEEQLVQLALLAPDRLLVACTPAALRTRWRRCLSRFPGGAPEVPEDRAPPSRAYRKLLEAELHLGAAISAGQRCVDLGASPGGWTHVALARGARVVAVDRSPLRADLMAHPQLVFRRGDGFRFAPEAPPVDWLLCDVIAFPERTIELLERWVCGGLCRRFVVSIKFRGLAEYPRLEQAKRVLDRAGAEYAIRRLHSGKNEVAAIGTLGP